MTILAVFPLQAQERSPEILQIYRDFVKPGSEAAYRAVEEEAARICVDLGCPHPHLAIETLSAPFEVWWLNAYASEAEIEQVANAYRSNRGLMIALEEIARRKQSLTGTPEDLFVRYRSDLSRGPVLRLKRTRFIVVTVTRSARAPDGSVFEASNGRRFILSAANTRAEADALATSGGEETRIFAVRPYWGMPAQEWIEADPEFWRVNPASTTQ
jgi:hypothetical protein